MEKEDGFSDISSGCFTPRTGFTIPPLDQRNDGTKDVMLIGDVPWPGKSYLIIKKHTERAITEIGTEVVLKFSDHGPKPYNSWLCVSKDNYTAFFNTSSGRFLARDGKHKMRAAASNLDRWEFFIPRLHPDGGFQLLSPWWQTHLMMVTAVPDGRIVRRLYGDTLWIFEEI